MGKQIKRITPKTYWIGGSVSSHGVFRAFLMPLMPTKKFATRSWIKWAMDRGASRQKAEEDVRTERVIFLKLSLARGITLPRAKSGGD